MYISLILRKFNFLCSGETLDYMVIALHTLLRKTFSRFKAVFPAPP